MEYKEVLGYHLDLKPCCKGENARFYLSTKKENGTIKYILKRFKKFRAGTLHNLLLHEKLFANKYSSSNSTTTFVEAIETLLHIYHVYEYYESTTLEEFLKTEDLQTLGRKSEIIFWIVKALDSLHDKGKSMHRNLKPSHILINFEKAEIKFCGNSSIYNFEKGYPTNLICNPPYKPPEFEPKSNPSIFDEKADIYSLGVILYEMLSKQHLQSSITITNESINELNITELEIKELISKCLCADPKKRPCSKELLLYKCFNSIIIEEPILTKSEISQSNSYAEDNPNLIRRVGSLNPYIPTGVSYGSGGYAKVIQVKKENTLETYALKLISIDQIKYEKEKELILNEIALLKEMSQSSFIVKIEDYFYFDKHLCLVLEECNGGDLQKHIENLKRTNKALKMDEIKLIAWNVAAGLYLLHKNYIVHRDIKPQNILLVKNNLNVIIDAKICDLGLSKKLKNGEVRFSSICGTVEYMAPEVRKMANKIGKEMTIIADSYSFGLFLLYLAFGEEPTLMKKGANQKIPDIDIPLPEYAAAYPDLFELIKKCLEEDPKNRIDFSEILNHPFLKSIQVPHFLNKMNISLNKNLKQHQGQYADGYLDDTKKFWIKIYNLKNKDSSSTEIKKSVDREIEFLVKCVNIPHIIKLIEFGIMEEGESIIEIFEFCDGNNLESLFIKRAKTEAKTTFSIREIKLVAKCLLEFVDNLHKRNYYHRAINPTHILTFLDEQSKEIKDVSICGFRTSKYSNIKFENSFCYSEEDLSYVDVDLFERNYYSEDSDLWSVGMVIYFLAFGKPYLKTKLQFENLRKNREMKYSLNIDKEIHEIIKYCTKSCNKSKFSTMTVSEFLSLSKIF